MVMTAAFFAFLHLYTGEDDIVVGSGLANRRVPGTEALLGMLVNTVPLRATLSTDDTSDELIMRIRDVCLKALAAQEIPFEEVVKRIAPDRDSGPSALYRHLFSFHDSPFPSLELPRLRLTTQEVLSNGSAKADLNVVVINRRGRDGSTDGRGRTTGCSDLLGRDDEADVMIVWEYCSDVFTESSARRMVSNYLHLLAQMVSGPAQRLSQLELTNPQERQALLRAAVNVAAYERDASIGALFAARVGEFPSACAVRSAEGELTYRELDERAESLARRLVARGVGPGTCVGVIDDRSLEMVVALVAVIKAGGAYVGLDPGFPAVRFDDLVRRSGIEIVCVSEGVAQSAQLQRVRQSGTALLPVGSSVAAPGADGILLPDMGAEDLAYVSFTSGSTGEPKGVEVVHRGVVRLVRGTDYVALGSDESLLAMAPLSFDASTFEIWGALLNGGRLVLAPRGPLSPREIADVLRAEKVTTLFMSTAIFHQMVDYELASLALVRQVIAGGEVLSPRHVNQFLQALPQAGVFVAAYGPTETTTFACCLPMPHGHLVEGPVPIGRPIANTTVHVLDDRRRPVPVGVPGELYIGGDGVARGYLGRPDLTEDLFVPDPFSGDGGRLYRSGDLGRWATDGTIQFLGRRDRQVKIRGFRVEPAEAEEALRRHPGVSEARVVPRSFGPDDKRLVAYVTGTDVDVRDDELQAHLAGILPSYLRPAVYVWMEALPLTPTGKVDTQRLPDPPPTWTPADASADGTSSADASSAGRNTLSKAAGASRLEQRLITLWQEVLGVRPIGLDEGFFDLGGHSLLAVSLFAEIERTTGARLPLATIFEAPTVRQMAALMREGGWDSAWDSLVALTTTGSRSPIFCVTAGDGNTIGFGALARRLGPDQPFYALQPRGLDGRVLMHRSVEGMAEHYVRQIRHVQPHGPYVLGGRCFGTLVAYEMTRILEGAGERVALLLALDSVGPLWQLRRLANDIEYDQVMNLCRLRAQDAGTELGDIFGDVSAADRFVDHLREPGFEAGGSSVSRYLLEAYRARPDLQVAYAMDTGDDVTGLQYWAWEGGISEMGMNPKLLPPVPEGVRKPKPSADPRHRPWYSRASARCVDWVDYATRGRSERLTVRRQARLLEIATQTVLYYRGGRTAVRVALIRSDEYRDDPQLARWYGLETGGVDEYHVRGSHQSLLREPDVAALAQCIEGCMDAVSAEVVLAD
jgi:aspartate racemase